MHHFQTLRIITKILNFFTLRLAPFTSTEFEALKTLKILPTFPLSLPDLTCTKSPRTICHLLKGTCNFLLGFILRYECFRIVKNCGLKNMFNYQQISYNLLLLINMNALEDANTSLRLLHLGLQLVVGYWSAKINGYSGCQEPFANYVSYMGYALIGINIVISFFIRYQIRMPFFFIQIVLGGCNIALAGIILYFSIEGYNKHSGCAVNKVLFAFFIMETSIGLLAVIFLLFGNVNWAQIYTNWPGNLAWPVLFLAPHFHGVYSPHMLAIGILYSLMSVSGFAVNVITAFAPQQTQKKRRIMRIQWSLSMLLMVACQIYAIVVLATTKQQFEEYQDVGARKTLMIFSAVNIVDFLFWMWGYREIFVRYF